MISVCLLVKDEAHRLEQSLPKFAELKQRGKIGEILAYLDDRTSDESRNILQKYGAVVIEGPWLGFSKTRKLLWSMAAGDWILWLDADEIFSDRTLQALARVGCEVGVGGYRIRRRVVFEGQLLRHGDWGNDRVLRIFRKNAYQMDERVVHESVSVPGRVVNLPGIVEHHSFRNWADLRARSAHYAELWAQQNGVERNRKSSVSPFAHALGRFLKGYILKSGWLDGLLGFRIALHNATEVFDKYRRLQNASKNRSALPHLGSL